MLVCMSVCLFVCIQVYLSVCPQSILLDSLLQEVMTKGNSNSNLSNTTEPIVLDSLLQEVTWGAMYLCIYASLCNKGIFSLQQGDLFGRSCLSGWLSISLSSFFLIRKKGFIVQKYTESDQSTGTSPNFSSHFCKVQICTKQSGKF